MVRRATPRKLCSSQRRRRPGRDAICPPRSRSARASAACIVATLVFAPRYLGGPLVAAAILVATHEVVRRLREAGYRHSGHPAAGRRPGHRLADLAVPCRRRAGRLRRHRRGLHVLAVVHAGQQQTARAVRRFTVGELPAGRVGHRLPGRVGPAVRLLRGIAGLSARRRGTSVLPDGHRRRFRRRAATPWGCCSASIRWSRRSARRSPGRDSPVRWSSESPRRP